MLAAQHIRTPRGPRYGAVLLGVLCFACGAEPLVAPSRAPLAPPARPERCRDVRSDESLSRLAAEVPADGALCLGAGVWIGKVLLTPGAKLWGTKDSVIKTDGDGTTVVLSGGSALLGVTVDGSGGRFDVLDAAVHVTGEGVTVEGVTVKNAVFGILVEKARGATLRGNHVIGLGGPAFGLRGDGIRLWETQDSLVEDNRVEESRDCVVWYSSGNVLRRNDVRGSRYGMHLMYSHRNLVEDNDLAHDEVGIFLMYSREAQVLNNRMWSSRGTTGMGIGIKESGKLVVRGNSIADNAQGLFIDTSPIMPEDHNTFEDNVLRLNDVGITFLSSSHDNTFRNNAIVDNFTSVRVDGGGDVLDVEWTDNEWSDYVGYDLDGDGTGDVPFELRDLSDALASTYPSLTFLRGTPALALVSVAGEVAPLLAPKMILRDPRPRLSRGGAHAD